MIEDNKLIHYRNISISGLPGGGSTTLLTLLKEALKFKGWKGFSGGEFMRSYALETGLFEEKAGMHHDSRHYEDDFDRKIDFGMRDKLEKEEHWIIESWLSGFLAQGLPGVLKILVYCSDDAVRVDRIINRDDITVEQAVQNMKERYEANLTKWTRLYKQQWHDWVVKAGKADNDEAVNFWKPELYDLVIDTYSTNKEQTLQKVLNEISR